MWMIWILLMLFIGSLKVTADEETSEINKSKGSSHAVEKKRQDLIPYPRMGRSPHESLSSQLLQKQSSEKVLKKKDGSGSVGSEYILPYPRPGRETYQDKLGNSVYFANDMMIPALRVGRSKRQDHILPYPRLGKDLTLIDDEENLMMLPYSRVRKDNDYLTPYPRVGKRFSSDLVPYPRLGRSYSNSRTDEKATGEGVEFRSYNSDYMTPYPRLGKREFTDDVMIPYPRLGRSNSDSSAESIYLTPYPRLGKRADEDTLLPYPRVGRSYSEKQETENDDDEGDEEEPMQYLTPYPRLGKQVSHVLLPEEEFALVLKMLSESFSENFYPRFRISRSNSNNDMNETSSTSLYDNDAPDQVTMIPNPRFGRSKTSHMTHNRKRRSANAENQVLLPYPRLGRDTVSYTLSDSAHKNIKPYFTVFLKNKHSDSKSHTNQLPPNTPDSTYMLPYPRPGRSEQLTSDRINTKVMNNHRGKIHQQGTNKNQEPNSNEYYLLPYPRPGRSLIG